MINKNSISISIYQLWCTNLLCLCSLFEPGFPAGSCFTELPPAVLQGGYTVANGLRGELPARFQFCSILADGLKVRLASWKSNNTKKQCEIHKHGFLYQIFHYHTFTVCQHATMCLSVCKRSWVQVPRVELCFLSFSLTPLLCSNHTLSVLT